MFDQNAELEEIRRLDKLLNVLVDENQQSSNESEDEETDEADEDLFDGFKTELLSKNETSAPSTSGFTNFSPRKLTATKSEGASIDISHITSIHNLFQHISLGEFDVITDCKDAQLKELLVLNRAKNVQIKALIVKYQQMLSDTESSIQFELRNATKFDPYVRGSRRITRCGFPYFNFKDSRPGNNRDFYLKKANNYINFSYDTTRRKWKPELKKKLKTCVMFNYYRNYLIAHRGGAGGSAEISLVAAMKDVDKVAPPELYDDEFIQWHVVAEDGFKDITLAPSLRALWNNYVHPHLNTSEFTKEETERLFQFIAHDSSTNSFTWLEIARELETNRGEYQICAHFQRIMNLHLAIHAEATSRNLELPTPDGALLRWRPSWKYFPISGFTRVSNRLAKREQYIKVHENCKMGRFSIQEDFKILSLVKKYGENFDRIAEVMPHRTKQQIQQRYNNNICREHMEFSNFQLFEDQAMLGHVKQHGERNWGELAKYLPRNEGQLRHRYGRLKKLLELDPELDLASLPRRGGFNKYLKRQSRVKKQAFIVEKVGESELDAMAEGKIPRWRMYTDVDDELVEFFSHTAQLKKTKSIKSIKQDQLVACAKTVETILKIFEVRLELPGDFEGRKDLDRIDVKVLTILMENQRNFIENQTNFNENQQNLKHFNEIQQDLNENPQNFDENRENSVNIINFKMADNESICIPPNVSSTQSLRYFLLESFNLSKLTSNPSENSPQVQNFRRRFKQFFKIPSLMSITVPSDTIRAISTSNGSNLTGPKILAKHKNEIPQKRKVGRPRKNFPKVKMMIEAKKRAEFAKQVELENIDSAQSQDSLVHSEDNLQTSTEKNGLSFVFADGKLVPVEEESHVLESLEDSRKLSTTINTFPPTEREVTNIQTVGIAAETQITQLGCKPKAVVPTVLYKVDKTTIEMLKQQKMLKQAKPIVIKRSIRVKTLDVKPEINSGSKKSDCKNATVEKSEVKVNSITKKRPATSTNVVGNNINTPKRVKQ